MSKAFFYRAHKEDNACMVSWLKSLTAKDLEWLRVPADWKKVLLPLNLQTDENKEANNNDKDDN